MTRLVAVITALAVALGGLSVAAQAGMRVGIGIGVGGVALGAMSAMSKSSRSSEARGAYRERKKTRTVRREREEKPTRTAKSRGKSESAQKASKEPEDKASVVPAVAATADDGENSSIAGGVDRTPPSEGVTTGSTEIAAESEASSIALAGGRDEPREQQPRKIDTASQTTKALDCKKFFPSVGMTLSAPCE